MTDDLFCLLNAVPFLFVGLLIGKLWKDHVVHEAKCQAIEQIARLEVGVSIARLMLRSLIKPHAAGQASGQKTSVTLDDDAIDALLTVLTKLEEIPVLDALREAELEAREAAAKGNQ